MNVEKATILLGLEVFISPYLKSVLISESRQLMTSGKTGPIKGWIRLGLASALDPLPMPIRQCRYLFPILSGHYQVDEVLADFRNF